MGCMRSPKLDLLRCSVDVDSIKTVTRNLFNADSVVIYSKTIKEEVYFTEIHSPVILIYNAKTNVLDFKSLPTAKYRRFDNFEQIESELKQEGLPVAKSIINNCDMTGFNDLIIEFLKLDDKGKPIYRFICHYRELL